ncbi:uncharacterized protein [Linepithema humile]|uniref:uncharacterized protein n=1 Tax=Linepithema humile TaxID=83485 RepID=UPI000623A43D|nr:PREDICTED: uncharacterized protein LOC105677023 [Linepithema humile]
MPDNEDAHIAAKAKRKQAKAACTRARTFVEELGDRQVSVSELRQRQMKLRECWQIFEDVQSRIEMLEATEEHEVAHNEERRIFEDKYFEVDAKLEELITRAAANEAMLGPNPFGALQNIRDNVPVPNMNVRLLRIDLPSFSGAYEDWRPFRDAFMLIIHENAIVPAIQKMQYLKASLKSEAAAIISARIVG